MSATNVPSSMVQPDEWLAQAFPEIHFLLLGMDGDDSALDWLRANSPGVHVLTRAILGKKKALATLHSEPSPMLVDLFELVENDDLCNWLSQRRPEVHLLFEAIRDNDQAHRQLNRKRPALARLALVVRELYKSHRTKPVTSFIVGKPETAEVAAEMGCLIGEMHLRQGDYAQAVEAFTRAIETRPAADLYEGRAQAYRGLADADYKRSALMRGG